MEWPLKIKRLQYSVLVELDQIGKSELGDHWYRENAGNACTRSNDPSGSNTLKSNMKQVITVLETNRFDTIQGMEYHGKTIKINQRINLFTSDLFKQGICRSAGLCVTTSCSFYKSLNQVKELSIPVPGRGNYRH